MTKQTVCKSWDISNQTVCGKTGAVHTRLKMERLLLIRKTSKRSKQRLVAHVIFANAALYLYAALLGVLISSCSAPILNIEALFRRSLTSDFNSTDAAVVSSTMAALC